MTLFRKCLLLFSVIIGFCFFIIDSVSAVDTSFKNCEEFNNIESDFLDINEAFMIALAGNPTIEIFTSRINQAKQRVLQTRSSYWPTIRIGFNGLFKEEVNVNQWDINASWFFFDGFKRKFENIIADCDEKISIAAHKEARRLLLLSVSEAFYRAQLSRENIKITIADEVFNKRQLKEAETRYNLGTGSMSDVLNFKISLNKAKMNRVKEEENYEVAMLSLASLLGNEESDFFSNVTLAPLLDETDEELKTPCFSGVIRSAIERRPDVNIHELIVKSAEAGVSASKAGFYPEVYISASINAMKEDGIHFCNDDVSSRCLIGLSYDLFSGGIHTARVREAKEREIESIKELRKFLISTKAEIRSAYLRVCNAQIQVISQRENAELIENRRDLVEKEYNNDRGTLLSLNEIQNELIKSRSQLAGMIAALRHAWVNFKFVSGGKLN